MHGFRAPVLLVGGGRRPWSIPRQVFNIAELFRKILFVGWALCGAVACDYNHHCLSNAMCASDHYCDPVSHVCYQDCTGNDQCWGGRVCSSRGQCVVPGAKSDRGTKPEDMGGDGPAKVDLAAPDCGVPDVRPPDVRPGVEAGQRPDMKKDSAPDVFSPPDRALPDRQVPDVGPDSCVLPDVGTVSGCKPPAGTEIIGRACAISTPCPKTYRCLLDSSGTGVCTRACAPKTNPCPGASGVNICAEVKQASGSIKQYCLRTCRPRYNCNECLTGTHCRIDSGKFAGLHHLGVCIRQGCVADSDCLITTKTPCTVAKGNCPAGQKCTRKRLSPAGAMGLCAKRGVCDKTSGLCKPPLATTVKPSRPVGAPCKADQECGPGRICMAEVDTNKELKALGAACATDLECCSERCSGGKCKAYRPCGVKNRNGYCTIAGCLFSKTLPDRACPCGSLCNIHYFGGLCQKECRVTDPTSCRSSSPDRVGDYECRNWANLQYGGVNVAWGATCDFGHGAPCDKLQSLSCSIFGYGGNPTRMLCRKPSMATTNANDPAGFCLDDPKLPVKTP